MTIFMRKRIILAGHFASRKIFDKAVKDSLPKKVSFTIIESELLYID